MKVGDLVKFQDVSSYSEWGRGHFQKLTGTLAVVVGFVPHNIQINVVSE